MTARPASPGPLVIVGDSFLDVDIEGDATRLCPDAPVPVVELTRRRRRPGGAGLAALLAAQRGAPVILITALGHDEDAETLRALLADRVEVIGMSLIGGTVTKTRIAAAEVPLLRLDTGSGIAGPGPICGPVLDALRRAGAVLVSDYGRGVTALAGLRAELESVARRAPVVWDPHPRGMSPVPGCRLVTPNAAEARQFGGDPAGAGGRLLAERWRAEAVAVTLGARGAVLARGGIQDDPATTTIIPVPPEANSATLRRSRLDTCGAGDQFAVSAALALRSGADPVAATRVAVAQAAHFVRAGAAASVSVTGFTSVDVSASPPVDRSGSPAPTDAFALAERVRRAGGVLVATGGCFDLLHPGHIELLEAARALGDALVVCLNSDESVRRAKGSDRPLVGQTDRARVLAALGAVDAVVIFHEDTPVEILGALQPDVWVKGSDYEHRNLPEAGIVQQYGGRVELVPLVSGYSTTSLVRTARRLAPVPTAIDQLSLEVS